MSTRYAGGDWKNAVGPHSSTPLIGYLLNGGTTDARPGLVEVLDGWLPHRLPTVLLGVAHSWRAPVEHRGGVWLKRGLPSSK
jgi:hypothetical protein